MDIEDEPFDVYGDLENFDLAEQLKQKDFEIKDLTEKINNLIAEITRIQAENKTCVKQTNVMQKSMSSLLQTAKNELKRKDSEITMLRKEKDDIIFRRMGNFKIGKLPPKIDIETQTDLILGSKSILNIDSSVTTNNSFLWLTAKNDNNKKSYQRNDDSVKVLNPFSRRNNERDRDSDHRSSSRSESSRTIRNDDRKYDNKNVRNERKYVDRKQNDDLRKYIDGKRKRSSDRYSSDDGRKIRRNRSYSRDRDRNNHNNDRYKNEKESYKRSADISKRITERRLTLPASAIFDSHENTKRSNDQNRNIYADPTSHHGNVCVNVSNDLVEKYAKKSTSEIESIITEKLKLLRSDNIEAINIENEEKSYRNNDKFEQNDHHSITITKIPNQSKKQKDDDIKSNRQINECNLVEKNDLTVTKINQSIEKESSKIETKSNTKPLSLLILEMEEQEQQSSNDSISNEIGGVPSVTESIRVDAMKENQTEMTNSIRNKSKPKTRDRNVKCVDISDSNVLKTDVTVNCIKNDKFSNITAMSNDHVQVELQSQNSSHSSSNDNSKESDDKNIKRKKSVTKIHRKSISDTVSSSNKIKSDGIDSFNKNASEKPSDNVQNKPPSQNVSSQSSNNSIEADDKKVKRKKSVTRIDRKSVTNQINSSDQNSLEIVQLAVASIAVSKIPETIISTEHKLENKNSTEVLKTIPIKEDPQKNISTGELENRVEQVAALIDTTNDIPQKKVELKLTTNKIEDKIVAISQKEKPKAKRKPKEKQPTETKEKIKKTIKTTLTTGRGRKKKIANFDDTTTQQRSKDPKQSIETSKLSPVKLNVQDKSLPDILNDQVKLSDAEVHVDSVNSFYKDFDLSNVSSHMDSLSPIKLPQKSNNTTEKSLYTSPNIFSPFHSSPIQQNVSTCTADDKSKPTRPGSVCEDIAQIQEYLRDFLPDTQSPAKKINKFCAVKTNKMIKKHTKPLTDQTQNDNQSSNNQNHPTSFENILGREQAHQIAYDNEKLQQTESNELPSSFVELSNSCMDIDVELTKKTVHNSNQEANSILMLLNNMETPRKNSNESINKDDDKESCTEIDNKKMDVSNKELNLSAKSTESNESPSKTKKCVRSSYFVEKVNEEEIVIHINRKRKRRKN